MQHDHGYDIRGTQPINEVNVARQLVLVEGREWSGLQARPFDAEAIGVDPQRRHPFDVFGVTVVIVTRNAAMIAVLRGEIRPLVLDMAFDLSRGGRGSPEKIRWEFQDVTVAR